VNNVGGPPGSNFGFDSEFGTFPDPTHLLGSAIAVNGGQSGTNAWYLDGNLNISSFGENIVINPLQIPCRNSGHYQRLFSRVLTHRGWRFSQLIKNCGQTAFAFAEALKVGRDWTHSTGDKNLLESVRKQLGSRIAATNCGS
jgi:hypothetical protein